jgi:hypothetical protein
VAFRDGTPECGRQSTRSRRRQLAINPHYTHHPSTGWILTNTEEEVGLFHFADKADRTPTVTAPA